MVEQLKIAESHGHVYKGFNGKLMKSYKTRIQYSIAGDGLLILGVFVCRCPILKSSRNQTLLVK